MFGLLGTCAAHGQQEVLPYPLLQIVCQAVQKGKCIPPLVVDTSHCCDTVSVLAHGVPAGVQVNVSELSTQSIAPGMCVMVVPRAEHIGGKLSLPAIGLTLTLTFVIKLNDFPTHNCSHILKLMCSNGLSVNKLSAHLGLSDNKIISMDVILHTMTFHNQVF